MPKDFKIDLETQDLVQVDGVHELVEDGEEVQQHAVIVAKTHLGECEFDTAKGIPWRDEIFELGIDEAIVAARLRAAWMDIPEVTGILRMDITIDYEERDLDIDATLDSIYGPIPVSL